MTTPQSQNTTAPIDSTNAKTAAVFDQIERAVAELKPHTLPPADPDTVGRDAQAIRELLDRIVGYELKLAQLMGFSWTPVWSGQSSSASGQ